MKVVIIATEPSGDYLGSELMKSLNKNKKITISGVGGELMNKEGLNSWVSMDKFNAIGIFEVLIRIFKFLKLFNLVEDKIRHYKPDILITIDSPSFSYRIVKRLQDLRKKIKFIHYVAPTVWAWKSYRAKIFSELYDKIFTLFDFEPKYFLKHGLDAECVGHQIFYKKNKNYSKKTKNIIFLPGSRAVEIKNNIKKLVPVINLCIKKFKKFNFYILTFKENEAYIKSLIDNQYISVVSAFSDKYKLMSGAYLAVAASGSVTLELIKYKIPTIVVYETHWLTKFFIKLLVRVKYASIINIFYDKEIIPEFLFEKFEYNKLNSAIFDLIQKKELRNQQLSYFKDFSKKMLINGANPAELIRSKLEI